MPNPRQARLIEPILTTMVRGYENNDYVGSELFPVVDVVVAGGQVIQFGLEQFLLIDTQRAPSGTTNRIDIGFGSQKYATENHALEALVADEINRDAMMVPHINLAQVEVLLVYDVMALRLEWQQATTARNPLNYAASNKIALSSTALWSATTSTPKADVQVARMAIRAQTGKYPNVMILPPGGIYKLQQHPTIRDQFKYVSAESITAAMLAKYFEVETLREGNAVYANSLNGPFLDVWGNDVILAYVPKINRTQKNASYGYTYQLAGHPFVKTPYRDENRDSWVYGVKNERVPVIAGAGAGFLIQNAF